MKSLVININANNNPVAPLVVGVDKLYGKINFNYKFTYSGNNYSDSFNFTSENYNEKNKMLTTNIPGKNKVVVCSLLNQLGYEFACLMQNLTGSANRDMFIFNVNSKGIISGNYNYCLASTSDSKCAEDVLLSPDGSVSGNIISYKAASLKNAETGSANTPESKEQLKALQLQHEAKEPSTESATPEQLDAVLDAFERLAQ